MRAAVIGLALSGAVAAAAASAQAAEPRDVYVLAGQSNMSGRGALADLTAAERTADPRIRLYGNDGRWRDARDPLDDAANQIDPVSADPQAAVGPGLPFARSLAGRRGRSVGLVPCAKGGTGIAAWAPHPERSTLYGSCVARVREAKGQPAGLLWYQGESDTRGAAPGAWRSAFATIVTAFRKDLQAPGLPIVFAQIADRPRIGADRYPDWTAVQAEQAQVSLPCVAMVSTHALGRNPDDLHLTTDAQRALGQRMAKAMSALRRQGCG